MKITNISIGPALSSPGAFILEIEIHECRYTGMFEDFGGFLSAISEAARFFAVRAGKLRVKDANLTRVVLPGNGLTNEVLPGDKTH